VTTAVTATWASRVDAANWNSISTELDAFGCALIGPLLSADETREIAALYDDDARFRSTIDMGRYRFGEGEYRYFARPFPEPVVALKEVLYPRLLPIARQWWTRLDRDTPWPESLDEWLAMCHAAGQTRSTPILLKYDEGVWNALHRDLAHRFQARLDGRARPPWCVGDQIRPSSQSRPRVPRRRVVAQVAIAQTEAKCAAIATTVNTCQTSWYENTAGRSRGQVLENQWAPKM
jgi:Oxygenase, catalysing oxidative methylation of damaged DNA